LRENHSGMETARLISSILAGSARCVRTIVVWKHITTKEVHESGSELRENHSGMETYGLSQ